MADSATDSEDEDYIPEADSDSDWSAGEGQEETHSSSISSKVKKGRSKKGKQKSRQTRTRRKGGIKLQERVSDEEESGGRSEEEEEEDAQASAVVEDQSIKEEKEKARLDELWASFKTEVKGKVTDRLTTPSFIPTSKGVSTEVKEPVKTITVTKKYDYAGEDVVVEREVPKDSKEARQFLQSQQTATATPARSAHVSTSKQQEQSTTTSANPSLQRSLPGVKRSSGLSAVLGSINKKPKMSTLEKSKLDWTKFKQQEGLQDELNLHNKDGYLEKQDFLHRTEQREFERDREERLKGMRRLH